MGDTHCDLAPSILMGTDRLTSVRPGIKNQTAVQRSLIFALRQAHAPFRYGLTWSYEADLAVAAAAARTAAPLEKFFHVAEIPWRVGIQSFGKRVAVRRIDLRTASLIINAGLA